MTTDQAFPEHHAPARSLPEVRLEQFEGPLDVLLHLIRSQELDIFDIPIALIARQYMEILERQTAIDLEAAGDYLVMASTLMQLKSRMLLPRQETDDEGNEIDPRQELVAQLIAYEQFRTLAAELDERPRVLRDIFLRPIFPEAKEVQRPLPEADLSMLLTAFRRVLRRVGGEVRHRIFTETISVREQMGKLLERLQQGRIELNEFLESQPGKEALVTTILALLELWRQQAIVVIQSQAFGPITLLRREEEHAETTA
ncbi:MAG: segregation/condensation protein A [Zetaproteobacteria bacterium]|nr:MAG: segregation/condensation protein A [Zetaproteobacteria bacterium]